MDEGLRFAIREGGRTVGAGVVAKISSKRYSGAAAKRTDGASRRAFQPRASSSIGRAAVSKTAGWGFESLLACQPSGDWQTDVGMERDERSRRTERRPGAADIVKYAGGRWCWSAAWSRSTGSRRSPLACAAGRCRRAACCARLMFLTQPGRDAREFLSESRFELRKVVWPTRQETWCTTLMVIMVVIVISLSLAASTWVSAWGARQADRTREAESDVTSAGTWFTPTPASRTRCEQALRDRIVRTGMQDKFGEVLVPTEEVVEMRAGQKRRPSASSSRATCWCRSRWTTRAGTWSRKPRR